MPYDDGFNTWFRGKDGRRVYIGPKVEIHVAGEKIETEITYSAEDEAEARAAGYKHISSSFSVNGKEVEIPPPTLDLKAEPEQAPPTLDNEAPKAIVKPTQPKPGL